jgi:hypothetical protein
MDYSLEELLFQFCLYHCPDVLQDDNLFTHWLAFIHAILREQGKKEHRATRARLVLPSNS